MNSPIQKLKLINIHELTDTEAEATVVVIKSSVYPPVPPAITRWNATANSRPVPCVNSTITSNNDILSQTDSF